MGRILGLDVSTSCIGVCIIDDEKQPDDNGSHIILLDKLEFKDCKTFWDKCDEMTDYFKLIKSNCVHRVALEQPLMGFRTGMSSAQTITTLMRFNGIVSYVARDNFLCDPEYISAAHARKLCGIKLQKTAACGSHKEQVFDHMSRYDLKHVSWPTKKNGKTVDWSRDVTDAYVIARAAMLEQPS